MASLPGPRLTPRIQALAALLLATLACGVVLAGIPLVTVIGPPQTVTPLGQTVLSHTSTRVVLRAVGTAGVFVSMPRVVRRPGSIVVVGTTWPRAPRPVVHADDLPL